MGGGSRGWWRRRGSGRGGRRSHRRSDRTRRRAGPRRRGRSRRRGGVAAQDLRSSRGPRPRTQAHDLARVRQAGLVMRIVVAPEEVVDPEAWRASASTWVGKLAPTRSCGGRLTGGRATHPRGRTSAPPMGPAFLISGSRPCGRRISGAQADPDSVRMKRQAREALEDPAQDQLAEGPRCTKKVISSTQSPSAPRVLAVVRDPPWPECWLITRIAVPGSPPRAGRISERTSAARGARGWRGQRAGARGRRAARCGARSTRRLPPPRRGR